MGVRDKVLVFERSHILQQLPKKLEKEYAKAVDRLSRYKSIMAWPLYSNMLDNKICLYIVM